MQIGPGTQFSDVLNKFEPGGLTPGRLSNKHLRFEAGKDLYTHTKNPFIRSRKGPVAAQERAQKQQDGATKVKQTINQQYGAGTADRVFANIRGQGGPDLNQGVRRSDLATIQQAIVLDQARVPPNDALLQHLGTNEFVRRLEAVTALEAAKAPGNTFGLTASEKVAIYSYTSTDDCYSLNRVLRQPGGAPDGSVAKMEIDLIRSGMNKLPSVPGTSFRGAGTLPIPVADGYSRAAGARGDGRIVTEHAFTSTSASNDKSFGGGYQFTIKGDNGKDVSAFSKHDEQEVLYQPGTRFEVVRVEGQADYSGGLLGGEMHVMMREARR
jgi:hypothetical protein